MTYEQALNYINSLGRSSDGRSLERTRALLEKLGNPQRKTRFVHVAGTNGKGSTCAMLESILRAAGYKTGLFTSPYLHRFNERIRVGGEPIPDGELARLAAALKPLAGQIGGMSEFELDTALGLAYFAQCACDIVVLEVGLGGRLDPTNAIDAPDCAVITNIGLDHTALLGSTPAEIAREKAGILKPGCPAALYSQSDPGAARVLEDACRANGCPRRTADFGALELLSPSERGQRFRYRGRELTLPLLGRNQLHNAAAALEAIELLRGRGWKISEAAIAGGLANVRWPARFELASREPDFIIDGGHNPQCARSLAENLRLYYPERRRVLLLGIMADKDFKSFLHELAAEAGVFVCTAPRGERALPPELLAQELKSCGKPVFVRGSLPEAIDTARRAAGMDGVVCCAGSLYLAAEAREYFGLE